jgi:hypothetical protein
VVACGGQASDTESSSGPEDTTTTSIDVNEAVTAYTQCMRENGVDIDDPTTDAEGNLTPGSFPGAPQPGENPTPGEGPGLDEETQAAVQECSQLLDGTGLGFGGPQGAGDLEAVQEQMAELTACLEGQGLDLEQPATTGQGQPGVPFGGLGNLDFDDPEVQAAMEQCAEFFPDFGGQGGPGGLPGQGGSDG